MLLIERMTMAKHNDSRNIRVIQFLDAYEKQDTLWNSSLESYKNKTARDDAYIQIINELNVPTLTIQDVKLKVKSIRTTYTKELRLLIKHKESGKPYNPKLFWFNRANAFLKDVSLSREKRSSSNKTNEKSYTLGYIEVDPKDKTITPESTEQLSNIDDVGNTDSSTFEAKVIPTATDTQVQPIEFDIGSNDTDQAAELNVTSTKNFTHHTDDFPPAVSTTVTNHSKLIADPQSIGETNTNSTYASTNSINPCITADDDYDLFCRSVAAQLRSITDTYSRSVAKLKIQQILFEAETGYYRNNPCVTIPVQQNTI